MGNVEPTEVMAIRMTALYRGEERTCGIFVPAVLEYEDEEQEEGRDVFTKEDLDSEIETAMTLGDDGVLVVPSYGQNLLRGTIWLSMKNLMWIVADEPTMVPVHPPEGSESA